MQLSERTQDTRLITREATRWLASHGDEIGAQYADFLQKHIHYLLTLHPYVAAFEPEATNLAASMFLLGYYRGHEDLKLKQLLGGH